MAAAELLKVKEHLQLLASIDDAQEGGEKALLDAAAWYLLQPCRVSSQVFRQHSWSFSQEDFLASYTCTTATYTQFLVWIVFGTLQLTCM